MCQSEPQSSQAINKGYGEEILKPYDTPIGEPIRALVMTEKMYNEKHDVAERVLKLFVEATQTFRAIQSSLKNTCASKCSKIRLAAKTIRMP
ncbi:MAG: hypothetical protein WDM70_01530 [Nitrosomonadales bacterium]